MRPKPTGPEFEATEMRASGPSMWPQVLASLEVDGIAVLPGFVGGDVLAGMQKSFSLRLRRMRWNDFDGYEKTERYRHMVQDVLQLDQGFVDTALHPIVKQVLRAYLGEQFELVEAKGWLSLATSRLFHGWHADAWYDQERVPEVPREVKLGLYLTDVKSGAFNYIKGTHGRHHPRNWRQHEIDGLPDSRIHEVSGPAGTAFLFDTSGIHRQACPILEPRHAVFYNYHVASLPLQKEDVEYYRYHPLLLNAAFLGGLSKEDQRILGFGNKTNYISAFERKPRHSTFQAFFQRAFDVKLRLDNAGSRVAGILRRVLKGTYRA